MECDGCTLCCMVLPVPWLNKKPGDWCSHCDIGVGCKIWGTVDIRCKQFSCMYNQMDKANITLRPDKCKIVFEKMTDTIIHGTLHKDYEVTKIVDNQIKAFLQEGFSVIIESIGKRLKIFPVQDVTAKNIYKIFMDKVEANRGNRNLFN